MALRLCYLYIWNVLNIIHRLYIAGLCAVLLPIFFCSDWIHQSLPCDVCRWRCPTDSLPRLGSHSAAQPTASSEAQFADEEFFAGWVGWAFPSSRKYERRSYYGTPLARMRSATRSSPSHPSPFVQSERSDDDDDQQQRNAQQQQRPQQPGLILLSM